VTEPATAPQGPAPLVLVIDDERSIVDMLSIALASDGYRVIGAMSCAEGLRQLEAARPDLVLTDLRMNDGSGFDILKAARESAPDTPVIMITAYTTTRTAIDALKLGAYDYISKPFDVEELKHVAGKALERKRLVEENVVLRQKVSGTPFASLVGVSRRMRAVIELSERIGRTSSTVLITGESGTGKELIARAIHAGSSRAARPFISINCGAMPENLLESELFGHERGAFTGAVKDKRGLFQEAEGGTLFLDEIGETSLTMQVKLLRTLQDHVVRRVGGNAEEQVDVRIICATNKDLGKKVADGSFREDLFYRINVIPLPIPPLRERRDDIPHLVKHFLEKVCREQRTPLKRISAEAMRRLEAWPWPGNVRELENLIERTVALEASEIVTSSSLPEEFLRPAGVPASTDLDPLDLPPEGLDLEAYLEWVGRRMMQQALDRTAGVQTRAAELLRMSERSFRYYAKKYGLRREEDDLFGTAPREENE
jgi:DNA-binding NtrC family response regulator